MSGDIKMSLIDEYRASGELPDDPEILLKLHAELQATESGEKQAETTVETTDEVATDLVADEVKDDEIQAESDTPTPEGILSKDGKHVIPYDALVKSREEAQALKRELEEVRSQQSRLKESQATSLPSLPQLTDEQLAEMKEYMPEQYEKIVAYMEATKPYQDAALSIEAKLRNLEAREAIRQAEEAAKAAQTVQEEIDNNPVLSHWQRNDVEKWQMAVNMDTQLRTNDPEFANLTQAEQFAKVADAMVAIYGSPIKAVEKPVPAVAEVAKPNVVAAAKPVKQPPINSLADLGAGVPVESSLKERAEDMSQSALINNFMSMSADQRAEFIARMQ